MIVWGASLLLETYLKLMAFMISYTISVNPSRSTEYEPWASRVTGILIMQGSESGPDYKSTLDFEDNTASHRHQQARGTTPDRADSDFKRASFGNRNALIVRRR